MKESIQKLGFESDDANTIVFSFAGQGASGVVGYEWVNFFKDRPVHETTLAVYVCSGSNS